jgi:hypothetical protein
MNVITKGLLTAVAVIIGGSVVQDNVVAQGTSWPQPNLRFRFQAPIGHQQPRAGDLPPDVRHQEQGVPAAERAFDNKPRICRGC